MRGTGFRALERTVMCRCFECQNEYTTQTAQSESEFSIRCEHGVVELGMHSVLLERGKSYMSAAGDL